MRAAAVSSFQGGATVLVQERISELLMQIEKQESSDHTLSWVS